MSDTFTDHESIDVNKLIARFSHKEHVENAEAYFSRMSADTLLLRKPFYGTETQQILHGVSIFVQRLRLFQGARVLDFGAGTAWLSKIFAFLGCEPIALDVSRSALLLGRRTLERDPLAHGLKVSFVAYDGERFPLRDSYVDRIACFDSFHHVADQLATLGEFFRVLRPGGIVAFHEPGPNHSRSPQAQDEMRNHGVIENDIIIEDIWNSARHVGFSNMELAMSTPHALLVGYDDFNRLIDKRYLMADAERILTNLTEGLRGLRIFFLIKGSETIDSRSVNGLHGKIQVRIKGLQDGRLYGEAVVSNTGTAIWLPSEAGVGSVAIGIHLFGADGVLLNQDYARIPISKWPIEPNQSLTIAFEIPDPDVRDYQLVFDLVAERVTWFEQLGIRPVIIEAGSVKLMSTSRDPQLASRGPRAYEGRAPLSDDELLRIVQERLTASGHEKMVSFLSAWLDYSSARSNMPRRRSDRIPSIVRQLMRGRYHRFAHGFGSALRDLCK